MRQFAPIGRFLGVGVLVAVLLIAVTGFSGPEKAAQNSDPGEAKEILQATRLNGGLIVHLGCGDGRLTAALRASDALVVHGLDADAARVRQARERIQKLGIYGPVAVERFDGKRLPYAENMVNLLVADDLGSVTREEAMRVLAPGGTLCAKQDDAWTRTVKPRPENIDVWTHYLHDASGNPVAHDEVVGPPGSLQWSEGPRYTRSHEHIPGIYALVSTGARIFYILDEAPVSSIRRPPQWQLVARDAFNGILLWKKPVATWFPHLVNWGQTPNQLERKLIAVGNRVYVTLGLHAPLAAVDAATGDAVKVYENTRGTEEILLHQGILLLVVRSVTEERVAELAKWSQLVRRGQSPLDVRETAEPLVKQLRAAEATGQKAVLALEADSGRLLWKKTGPSVSELKTLSLCADADRVFYQNGNEVVCLDLKTGSRQWSKSSTPLRLVSQGNVVCADGTRATLLSAQSGETRWERATQLTEVRDAFVAGGSLWVGGFKPCPGKRSPAWGPYFATQLDLASGKLLKHIEPENPGHHHRCYSNKATDRYILGGRRGTEFIDLASGEVLWNSWARGVCKYGVMPSNGLLYVPPHACGCFIAAKLVSFNALAPRRPTEQAVPSGAPVPERGPAYDSLGAASGSLRLDEWPTYRHDAARSGCAGSAVPADLRLRWRAHVGGKLSALTVADGKVFVASVDEHRVSALDAQSGQPAWEFTAGARVDSPPSIHQGSAIFGCRDGYLYSVRASDGAMAWRQRAAREERRVVVCGQLESVWPVPGSVLVHDGAAYVTAGRSSYLDGGIDLCRLEPQTGKTLSRTSIYSPDPETGKQPPHLAPAVIPGAREDILTGDGGYVYLRDMVFDKQGQAWPEGGAHLLTLTGFLDDSWPHRSYWIFGNQCSIATGCSGRDKQLIYGRLLAFDESTIYGYGRAGVHWSNQLQDGLYRLFAVNRGEGAAQWEKPVPIHVRAMVLARNVLFLAGPPAAENLWPGPDDPGQKGMLLAISASDGSVLAEHQLDGTPVFDGMAAAGGRLYVSLENGSVVCMEGKGGE